MPLAELSAGESRTGPVRGSGGALLFRIARNGFALAADAIQEVLPFVQLEAPPGLPSGIAGFLQIGSQQLPVLRLATLFGLPEQSAGLYTPLLVLRKAEGQLALWVDEVERIVPLAYDALAELPRGYALHPCVAGLLAITSRQVLLLDATKLAGIERALRERQDIERANLEQEVRW